MPCHHCHEMSLCLLTDPVLDGSTNGKTEPVIVPERKRPESNPPVQKAVMDNAKRDPRFLQYLGDMSAEDIGIPLRVGCHPMHSL